MARDSTLAIFCLVNARAVPAILFAAVLSTVLSACVPSLDGWELARVDGGPRPGADGGPDAGVDAQVPRDPIDDCSSPRPLGAMYVEGFEGGAGGWGATAEPGAPLSWRLGTPAGEHVMGAASGTRAWATIPYLDREDSYVVSPCLDASGSATDLLLTLSRAYETESPDRTSVELSVDGGPFTPVDGEARLNWYGTGSGWSGQNTSASDWKPASALLPGTAGRSRVQIRLHFHSDGSVLGDGFAFDDVMIRPATRDLAISLEEADRCGWTIATVRNVGGLPATGFEVRWSANGMSGTVPYDRTMGYLDEEVVEVGAPLARLVMASLFEDGDTNPANDAASFTSVSVPLGGGYQSNFESDDGGLTLVGTNTSMEWGEPRGALISTAASGSRAWVTNLTGDYNGREDSILRLPCYDLTSAARDPQISLARAFDTESCCDRAYVEVSIDGGAFQRLGSSTSGGTGWYGGTSGWAGSSGGGAWGLAQHPLTGTRGHAAVRIQIHFHSDGSTEAEGFGLDDLGVLP